MFEKETCFVLKKNNAHQVMFNRRNFRQPFQSFFMQNCTTPDSVASIVNATPLKRNITQKIKMGNHPVLQDRVVKCLSHSY